MECPYCAGTLLTDSFNLCACVPIRGNLNLPLGDLKMGVGVHGRKPRFIERPKIHKSKRRKLAALEGRTCVKLS